MPQANFESIRKAKEKGIAVYLTLFFLMVLIPIVGLSIDGGYAFVIRSRLSAAADSAALAAGRGVNLSGTQAQANAQATTQATNFFNSDFPVGYMNTSASNRTVTPTFTVNTDSGGNPTGTLTINVTASVVAPTYFMRWVGINSLTIAATGTATRKNLVMELVLDVSSSMGSRSSSQTGKIPTSLAATDTSCQAMVYATSQFIKYFSPYDTIGEISFNLTVTDDYTASENYWESGSSGMDAKLENLQCSSNTNTTAALYQAYQDIKTVNQKLAQNVVVLFTDGVPNAVDATFPVRTEVDSRMSAAQGCSSGSCSGTCQDTNGTTLCTSGTSGYQACNSQSKSSTGCVSASGTGGMPVCTTTTGTIKTAIAQWADFSYSGGTRGVANMFSTDTTPNAPSGCTGPTGNGTIFTSQTIAYIPNSDYFGNSFVNIQTGASTTATSPWFQWLYQVNSQTAPSGTTITSGNSATKNLGALWTSYATTGVGAPNNTFTAGPYKGYLRPDLPNSIGVASMTSATNMAYTIRADTTYNPQIDVVYLQGNGTDPVDRSFLQLVSNQQYIEPIVYEATPPCPDGALATAANASGNLGCQTNGAFNNPYFQSNQQEGLWEQTASTLQLESMFEAIASSLLRISQ